MKNNKSKLIDFPEEILDALAKYKTQTGISASDYIRNSVCRRMIRDKIIWLKTIIIEVNTKGNGSKKSVDMTDAIEGNKFCDGASCEIPVQLPAKNS